MIRKPAPETANIRTKPHRPATRVIARQCPCASATGDGCDMEIRPDDEVLSWDDAGDNGKLRDVADKC
jgi:hypothetical protein